VLTTWCPKSTLYNGSGEGLYVKVAGGAGRGQDPRGASGREQPQGPEAVGLAGVSENCAFSARSAALLRCLPADFRADLDALDLAAHDLSRARARFILVHGIDDDMLPYGGSVGLAAALSSAQARLFLLRGFEHVDMSPRFADRWRMSRAICAHLDNQTRTNQRF